jgi:hypothetical protein
MAEELPYVKVDRKWWDIHRENDDRRQDVVDAARLVHRDVHYVQTAEEWQLLKELGDALKRLTLPNERR